MAFLLNIVFIIFALRDICIDFFRRSSRILDVPIVTCNHTVRNKSILSNCHSLIGFAPKSYLCGPFAQTVANIITRRVINNYRREYLELRDGVKVALDYKDKGLAFDTPIFVCLPGLNGHSGCEYMKTFTDCAYMNGYRCIVYNRRGHGQVSLLSQNKHKKASSVFPKYVMMNDMLEVVNHIQYQFGEAVFHIVGFSGGANLMVKYLALNQNNPFKSAVSVCNLYDINIATNLIKNKQFIQALLIQSVKEMISQNKDDMVKISHDLGIPIDIEKALRAKSVRDFDKNFIVPLYGYKDLEEYYRDSSCAIDIDNVSIPLLCISNSKDPFVDSSLNNISRLAANKNNNIIDVTTKYGGHLSWVETSRTDPWYIRLVFEFTRSI